MTTISRFQLNSILRAYVPKTSFYWPQTDLGQNVPGDNAYTTMRVFNDRALAAGMYNTAGNALLPSGSRDANGMPTTAFSIKVAEGGVGQFAYDPSVTGTWYMEYQSSIQRNITWVNSNTGSITVHTFLSGTGRVQFTYTARSAALMPVFDGAVTDIKVYDPTTSATAIAGTSVPRFNTQYLRTLVPYSYGRMMDISAVNGDYVTTSSFTWPSVINWTDRRTPTNYHLNDLDGMMAGIPLEWQVELCIASNKSGWFNISELASDDYITQFATYVAQNMPVGTWASFELGNERWNTGGGFYCYHKAGVAALTECHGSMAATSGNRFIGTSQGAVSFSSDGTTATVVFAQAHGATSGTTMKIFGAQTGFTGFAPVGATITVINSVTVTYPCSQASTGGTVTGVAVLGNSGFIALDASTQLVASGFLASAFDLSFYWHVRRTFQMAALVRAAFTAVGRSLSDCKPLQALQAGQQYLFGNKKVDTFITAIFGVALSTRLTAIAIGGYFGAAQGVINPGFGYTKSQTDPSLVTSAAINTQVQQVVDSALGAYQYTSFISWVRAQGLEAWGYEIGMDLTTAPGESGAVRTAKDAYQVDYTNYGANIEAMTLKWMRNLQALGFTKLGWYQCGAGTQTGYGGFNLGQTPNEIDYTTPSSGQSPKFRGLVDSLTPPTSAYAEHAFPCVLSGWDCVGNEAVVITGGVWPALSGTNLPYGYASYQGPSSTGQTYRVWSETTQTVTCTVMGDNTSTSNRVISVQPLGGTANTFTAPHNTVAGALGNCTITLTPGMNYVFISCATAPSNIFPHTVQFS
jgi:hypothetical protein